MHIKSSSSWQVYVEDDMDGKPDGTEGRMAEYNSGVYVTPPDGKSFRQPIHVISRNGFDVTLSEEPQLLEQGLPCNDMDRPLIISQWVEAGETHLENTNYRIVILFSAIPIV